MGTKTDRCVVVLAVVLCLAVFAGEYFTYYSDIHEFDVSAQRDDGSISYEVSSSGSDVYSALLIDNNGHAPVRELGIFVDENYSEYYDEVAAETGLEYLDQQYYAEQIRNALENRCFDDVTLCDSKGLEDYLRETSEDPEGKAIMVMSYALPSTVYTGNASDLLMSWISGGGTLYWLGSEIGAYYTDEDGLHRVPDNQVLFFGSECVNTDGPEIAESEVDNGFTDALSLKGSRLVYGVDISGLDNALAMGYSADGYSTVALVGHGNGAVGVFSGKFDIDQIDDVGQVIASGATPYSTIIGHEEGKVVRGTVDGIMELTSEHATLYVSIGGTYTKYGESFHV